MGKSTTYRKNRRLSILFVKKFCIFILEESETSQAKIVAQVHSSYHCPSKEVPGVWQEYHLGSKGNPPSLY